MENDQIGSNTTPNESHQIQPSQQYTDTSGGYQPEPTDYVYQNFSQSGYSVAINVKKRFPLALKIIIPILAVFIVIAGVATIFWRSAALAVFGTKNYYHLVELQNIIPQLTSISEPLAAKSPQYNSYVMTENIRMNSIDNIMAGTIVNTGIDPVKVLSDSIFEFKVGKNAAEKSLVADLNWKYKDSNLVTGSAYINKDRAVFNSPELLKENIYINSADEPMLTPLFDLSDQIAGQTNIQIDQKDLQKGIKDVLMQADSYITNKNIIVLRDISGDVDGTKVKCDEIVVSLTPDDVRKIMHLMLDTANKNNAVKDIWAKFTPYFNSINKMNAVSGGASAIDYSYTGLTKAIDSSDISGYTMTLLVRNGLLGTEVLSRDIKADDGNEILLNSLYGNRSGSIEVKGPDDDNYMQNDFKVNYVNSKTSLSGTVLLPLAGESFDKASGKMTFLVDKTKKTALGFYATNIVRTLSIGGEKVEISADTSLDGEKTKTVSVIKLNGKVQLTQTITIAGSSEILAVPDFDPNNSIDFVTDTDKLVNVQNEYGENLNNIIAKLGPTSKT